MSRTKGRTFKSLTETDVQVLGDSTRTNHELAVHFGLPPAGATISRWRKLLGIVVPRGRKPGDPRMNEPRVEREMRKCERCSNVFKVTPKSKRRFCSKRCAIKAMDRSYQQGEKFRNSLRKADTPEYLKYVREVWYLTKKAYKTHQNEINPLNLPRGLCGVPGAYQLDHIISIREGFDRKLDPAVIADKSNLQMLPWRENLRKGRKS